MARAVLCTSCIIIACCAAVMGAGKHTRGYELVPGGALEPLSLPAPELPPVDPRSLRTRLEAVSTVRVEVSEDGSINITPVTESLCDATAGTELSAPFVSGFGSLPFASWLEVSPDDVRAGLTRADDAAISDSTYGGLDWRLGLATHLSSTLALGDKEPEMGADLELPLSVELGGLSMRTAMLQSAWSSTQDAQISTSPQPVQMAYGLAMTISALEISGEIGLDSAELRIDQSDWRTKLGVSVASGVGSCTIRPQATLDLIERGDQPQSSLRAAIEVAASCMQASIWPSALNTSIKIWWLVCWTRTPRPNEQFFFGWSC